MQTRSLLAALLLLLFIGLGVHGAGQDTPTVDEFAHLSSGLAIWKHGDFRLYANNPPLGRLAVALPPLLAGAIAPRPQEPGSSGWEPWVYGERFLRANWTRYLDLFFLGRLASLAFAVLGGVLLHGWAARLYGGTAALGALALYVLCPNIQAHSRLATVDMACTTLLFATFVMLDQWRRKPALGRLLAIGALYGAALLTKFTALLLAPVLLFLLICIGFPMGWGFDGFLRGIGRGAARFLLVCAVALFIVNLGYLFQGTMRPVGNFQWTSQRCQTVASWMPAGFRIPLPREFLRGFDDQARDTERGEFSCYFAGQWHPRSPGTFYLAVLGLKLPLPTLLLLLATVVSMLRGNRASDLEEAFLWLVPAILLTCFSLFNALSGGIRYLLPLLPFVFLGISRLFADLDRPALKRPRGLALAACIVALGLTTGLTHPRQLGFFNSLAGGLEGGHRWLIDSNLDWGQDLALVRPYMEERGLDSVGLLYFGHVDPELYGIRYWFPPPQPRTGTYIVSINFALGYQYVAPDHGRTVLCRDGAPAWLRSRTPDYRLGSSLWVYHVP